jgi:hypothetical protein
MTNSTPSIATLVMQTHAHGVQTMVRKVKLANVLSSSLQVHPMNATCNMDPLLSHQ